MKKMVFVLSLCFSFTCFAGPECDSFQKERNSLCSIYVTKTQEDECRRMYNLELDTLDRISCRNEKDRLREIFQIDNTKDLNLGYLNYFRAVGNFCYLLEENALIKEDLGSLCSDLKLKFPEIEEDAVLLGAEVDKLNVFLQAYLMKWAEWGVACQAYLTEATLKCSKGEGSCEEFKNDMQRILQENKKTEATEECYDGLDKFRSKFSNLK